MAEWKYFEIPASLIGEQRVSGSTYVKTYQTEILLPKSSQYAGYCFLHPSKLVGGTIQVAKIRYTDSFTFTLIKKDREPGKRYKRYTLTVPEILDVYQEEMTKLRKQQEKREEARLSQVGSVVAVECNPHPVLGQQAYEMEILFHLKKKDYLGTGAEFGRHDRVRRSRTILESVSRKVFETAYEQLQILCKDYSMTGTVRYAIEHSENTSDRSTELYLSFRSLCDTWEAEFYERAVSVIEQAAASHE